MKTTPDTAAVAELAKRIRAADGDPEFVAAEFLAWLRARGWRPTEARPQPTWKPAVRRNGIATDEYRRIRAEWDARPHPNQAHPEGANDVPGA